MEKSLTTLEGATALYYWLVCLVGDKDVILLGKYDLSQLTYYCDYNLYLERTLLELLFLLANFVK